MKSFVRGLLWMSFGSIGARVVTLVSSVILARLLLPEHFGLFTAAMVVVNAVQILPDLGLGQTFIVMTEAGQRAYSTGFYAILMVSALLSAGVFFGADWAAELAHQPDVAPVLRVLALNIVVSAASSVPIALMQKAQRWRAQAMAEFAAPCASALVMVTMAYWGMGVWSIVGGYLTRSLVLALSVWVLSKWRPSGGIDWSLLKRLFAFSRWIVLERISAFALLTVDNAYLARWQGARMLGFYALPYNWIAVPVQYFVVQSSRVLLPVLSSVAEAERRQVFLKAVAGLSFVLSPLYLFWVFHADLFVVALFGQKWSPSVPVLHWLAAYGLAYSLAGGVFTSLFFAMKRPQLVVYPTWAALAIAVSGLVWGRGHWDALAVAKCFTAAIYLRAALMILVLHWMRELRIRETLRAVTYGWLPALFAGVVSAGAVSGVAVPVQVKLVIALIVYANAYLLSCGLLREHNALAYYRVARWKQLLQRNERAVRKDNAGQQMA